MRRVTILTAAAATAALTGLVFLACALPPAPPVSADASLVVARGVADPAEALTFARVRDSNGRARPLLVVNYRDRTVTAVPLDGALAGDGTDPFAVIAALGRDRLVRIARGAGPETRTWPLDALLPTGTHDRQIAAGANFRAHAEEVALSRVVLFPKFASPTPPVGTVNAMPGVLLDFEAELCLRFDRDIRSEADFDAALKGFFLCGDFTDRAAQARQVATAAGPAADDFTDSKSGPGLFPTGPFLVVPAVWDEFVRSERFGTDVDGVPRQITTGAEMLVGFRGLAREALRSTHTAAWRHRGTAVGLVEGGAIAAGMAILSGTPAGVLFQPPDGREIGCGVLVYICLGRFLTGRSLRADVIDRYLGRLRAHGGLLRPGQTVRHASERLGEIVVRVQ